MSIPGPSVGDRSWELGSTLPEDPHVHGATFDEADRCLDRGGSGSETTDACELHEQGADEPSAFGA